MAWSQMHRTCMEGLLKAPSPRRSSLLETSGPRPTAQTRLRLRRPCVWTACTHTLPPPATREPDRRAERSQHEHSHRGPQRARPGSGAAAAGHFPRLAAGLCAPPPPLQVGRAAMRGIRRRWGAGRRAGRRQLGDTRSGLGCSRLHGHQGLLAAAGARRAGRGSLGRPIGARALGRWRCVRPRRALLPPPSNPARALHSFSASRHAVALPLCCRASQRMAPRSASASPAAAPASPRCVFFRVRERPGERACACTQPHAEQPREPVLTALLPLPLLPMAARCSAGAIAGATATRAGAARAAARGAWCAAAAGVAAPRSLSRRASTLTTAGQTPSGRGATRRRMPPVRPSRERERGEHG